MVISASFKPPREIFAIPPTLIFTPTLDNYRELWRAWPAFFDNMLNSLIITIGATAITIAFATCAGYVYSRYSSRALTLSAFFMVLVRMLPPIVVTLPLFPVFSYLHLSDTHLVLMLLYAAFFVSLSTWIMRAFIDQVPRELEEAAVVDGATLLQILRRIVFPLVMNGVIAASLFVIVYAWNEYIFALVFTTRDARTTPLVISEILSTVEGVDWGVLFAAATVQLAPVLIFVLAAQRYVVAGLAAGAVKG
ncbi:carbohydrate ABC transporter permease [Roseomonas sp. ROY-5-3]|uniref:Carbohydrate ABC transporter permease n=2 Tax=Acetobacterales TaxID=3120395 RepID=A0ABS6HF00_9PROT|nr:carbohydrate ABC transporter permease [Roseomonas oleicola]